MRKAGMSFSSMLTCSSPRHDGSKPQSQDERGLLANTGRSAGRNSRLESETSLVVDDSPGGMAELTRALLMVADLALVPCSPSALDLEASTQAVRIIRQARSVCKNGLPAAVFVVNKLQPQTRLSRELLESAATIGIPVARMAIHFRQIYADAPGQRSVAWTMAYRGAEAASEVNQLFLEVTPHGQTSAPDRSDRR
jgi:chromosome partitioning protein